MIKTTKTSAKCPNCGEGLAGETMVYKSREYCYACTYSTGWRSDQLVRPGVGLELSFREVDTCGGKEWLDDKNLFRVGYDEKETGKRFKETGKRFYASWADSGAEWFKTFDEAKAWCQSEYDKLCTPLKMSRHRHRW